MAAQTEEANEDNMAKRYGHLTEKIIEQGNMGDAFDQVVDQLPERKVRRGNKIITKPGRRTYYRNKRWSIIERLTKKIASGSFKIGGYREMQVHDGPKDRIVQSPCVTDRIGCNAIMRVVEDVLYPSVIRTSAASIPGRGMHRLFAKMCHDIDNDPSGTRYFYKCDIKKFFESIDQKKMWAYIKKHIKDPLLLPELYDFVTMMDHGLSIGLRSSQCYGNIILNCVDHFFKDELGIKYYYRYCDDIVILAASKKKLWLIRDMVHEQTAKLGLVVKPSESVKPITEGIDFLGFVYDGKKKRLRKRIKQNAARKLHKVKSSKRRQEIIGSLKGMAQWCDSKHLFKILTGKRMVDSAEIKASVKSKDGKKWFEGEPISPEDLVDQPFVVVNFERDVVTKYDKNKHNDDGRPNTKYLVSILFNNEPRKFWTGNQFNKNKLEQAEQDGNLPFFTSLKQTGRGKRISFRFCSATELGFKMPSDKEVEKLIKKYEMQ